MDNYREKEYNEWQLYDSIVQSYRSNMIASQSLLLAVAAIFYNNNKIISLAVCVVGLICQWYIWYRIIRARAIISDFHKFNAKFGLSRMIDKDGNNNENSLEPLTEEIYVSNRSVQKKANEWLAKKTGQKKYKHNFRITRIKLDIILPVLFSIIWILIAVFEIIG